MKNKTKKEAKTNSNSSNQQVNDESVSSNTKLFLVSFLIISGLFYSKDIINEIMRTDILEENNPKYCL